MLSYRSRSRQEIVSDLCDRGFSIDVVTGVVSELEEKGLVGDACLARDMVMSGQRSNKSRSRIYADLRKRGIAREIAEDSLFAYFDEDEECEAAARVLRKMLPETGLPPQDGEKERAARRLSGRGFPASAVAYALNDALIARHSPGESPFLDTYSKLS
jgi:SOS response regulatory protein OraA/RecX